MEFEWDGIKNNSNIKRHGIDYSGPHKRDSMLRCISKQKETPNGQKEIQ